MVGCQDGGFAASQQSEDRRGFLDRAFFVSPMPFSYFGDIALRWSASLFLYRFYRHITPTV